MRVYMIRRELESLRGLKILDENESSRSSSKLWCHQIPVGMRIQGTCIRISITHHGQDEGITEPAKDCESILLVTL